MNGILIVDKPQGWTSHDVVAKLRGIYREKRIGHSGTLDPMATGVLVVFLGRATRAVELCENDEKTYIAGLRLGVTTNTQDVTGEILQECAVSVTEEQVQKVMKAFMGEQEQIPPMYSAVKIQGKKLYELARKGQEIERKPRRIHISQLELLEHHGNDYLIQVRCSKGTYIRTLCHDIGQALGCGGCLYQLKRTQAGRFSIEDAVTLDTVQDARVCDTHHALLRPVDSLFSQFPSVVLGEKDSSRCRNGAKIQGLGLADGEYRVYDQSGAFLMLGNSQNGVLETVKSFFEVK